MLFVLYCRDIADGADIRQATRPAHLDWARATDRIRAAGPMLADDGESMIGSLFVIEAKDLEDARAFNAADPYTRAGLWDTVNVHPFRWLLPEPRQ